MINSISSMSNYMGGMNIQAMQQRRDDLFTKIDSDSSGGLSKTEFSSFAEKLSADTGNSVNVDDVYSAYDTNGDGSLSKDELDNFMKDNAPPPPPPDQMQRATSAYGRNSGTSGTDQISSLLEALKNQSADGDSTSSGTTGLSSDYLSTLLSTLSSMLSNGNVASLLSVQA